MSTMNRETYAQLMHENLTWLQKQEHALEKDHLIALVTRVIDDAENVCRCYAGCVCSLSSPKRKGCNRHVDCSQKKQGSSCCFDEGCDDCFGA